MYKNLCSALCAFIVTSSNYKSAVRIYFFLPYNFVSLFTILFHWNFLLLLEWFLCGDMYELQVRRKMVANANDLTVYLVCKLAHVTATSVSRYALWEIDVFSPWAMQNICIVDSCSLYTLHSSRSAASGMFLQPMFKNLFVPIVPNFLNINSKKKWLKIIENSAHKHFHLKYYKSCLSKNLK